jgi:hypothetical protein
VTVPRSASVVAVIATLSLISVCAIALASPGAGEVGGPPTVELGPPDEGIQTSPARVIGVGSVVDGPVEIVAYGWEPEADSPPADFCVWVARPRRRENEFGTCGRSLDKTKRGAITLDMEIQTIAPKSARATSVGGRVSPTVDAVRLSFHRPGSKKQHRANSIVAQVSGALQQRLGQPAPFGFFYAKVRGAIGFGKFTAQALNAEGEVIGTVGPWLAGQPRLSRSITSSS